MKSQPLFLPRELYYRRIFQTLSNVPNIYFDNSIRWLPGFNGSNLSVLRHTPKAQTITARRIKEEGMNEISSKSSEIMHHTNDAFFPPVSGADTDMTA